MSTLLAELREAATTEQYTVTIANTAKALNVSRPTVYKLIRDGKLATFMIGSRRLTTPKAIQKCIRSLEHAA